MTTCFGWTIAPHWHVATLCILLGAGLMVGACSSDPSVRTQAPQPLRASVPETRTPHQPDLTALARLTLGDAQRAVWEDAGASAAGVAVVDGERSAVVTLGTLARDSARPFGPETLFEIGSVSKVFAGLLLAQAVIQGEVELADRLERYLGSELPLPDGHARQATLLEASALQLDYPFMPSNWTRTDRVAGKSTYTEAMFARFITEYLPAQAPGQGYRYGNVPTALLARALSNRLGAPYPDLLRERIFEPLAMQRSGYASEPPPDRDALTGYEDDGQPSPSRIDLSPIGPCCVVRSSLNDMSRFIRAALDPKSPLATAFDLQAQPRYRTDGPGESFIGLGLEWFPRERVWHKNGIVAGTMSTLILSPRTRQGLFVVANSEAISSDIDRLGFALARALFSIEPSSAAAHERVLVSELPRDLQRHPVLWKEPIQLEGWTAPDQAAPGQSVRVSFYFRALGALDQDWSLFVRAKQPSDSALRRMHDHYPGGLDSTLRWQPGELIRDTFEIRVPPDAQPGPLQLWFGWYAGARTMQVSTPELPDHRVPGPTLTVVPKPLNVISQRSAQGTKVVATMPVTTSGG